ncbi:MAG TPA: helix-turn-helix transcriptional regulator [Longimicrobiales bacterium]|nr:helix-turn-helix transcriptional regulator [Longimicrobiales bacterium]
MADSRGSGSGPLHDLERAILMVLLEVDAHAYGIVAELERRMPERRIYPANLYRRLNDMVDAGLLKEQPAPASADARQRCHYRVTAAGRRAARAEAERLERVVADARRLGLLRSR